jgi:hypothetical protein
VPLVRGGEGEEEGMVGGVFVRGGAGFNTGQLHYEVFAARRWAAVKNPCNFCIFFTLSIAQMFGLPNPEGFLH